MDLVLRNNKWGNQKYGNSWWSMRKEAHTDRNRRQIADSSSKELFLSGLGYWMWLVRNCFASHTHAGGLANRLGKVKLLEQDMKSDTIRDNSMW